MQETNVIKLLKSDLKFGESSISKLRIFVKSVIDANVKHNLISKNTENNIWHRHILDSGIARGHYFSRFDDGYAA